MVSQSQTLRQHSRREPQQSIETISDTYALSVATQISAEHNGIFVPGAEAGIITTTDIVDAVASGKDLSSATVGDVMTSPVERVTTSLELGEAAAMMTTYDIKHLPSSTSIRTTSAWCRRRTSRKRSPEGSCSPAGFRQSDEVVLPVELPSGSPVPGSASAMAEGTSPCCATVPDGPRAGERTDEALAAEQRGLQAADALDDKLDDSSQATTWSLSIV